MVNILLLLGTALAIFLSFVLFAGMAAGSARILHSLVLLCVGRNVDATLESLKRRRGRHSRRSAPEYQLTVSYPIGTLQFTKTFTSKNWNAFHDIQVGRDTVAVRVWTQHFPGWAALHVDLPDGKEWQLLAVLATIVAVVYAWFLRKVAFQILPSFLVPYGIDEEVSKYYILGACMVILPAYVGMTFYTLARTDDTQMLSVPEATLPPMTITYRERSKFSPVTTVKNIFLSVMRGLDTEKYAGDATALEMREILPQRRAPHEFV